MMRSAVVGSSASRTEMITSGFNDRTSSAISEHIGTIEQLNHFADSSRRESVDLMSSANMGTEKGSRSAIQIGELAGEHGCEGLQFLRRAWRELGQA